MHKENSEAPLVVHLIHRLAVGGLENGLVNLINRTSPDRFRHAIVSMTDFTDFRKRICNPNVQVFALHKREGQDFGAYVRLFKLLRKLRPDILHTRTFGTLEGQFYAALSGVRGRVHGEHGQALYSSKFRRLRHGCIRKSIDPLVHHYTTVNKDLANWLTRQADIRASKVSCIYNGVDIDRFHPNGTQRIASRYFGDLPGDAVVIGTVGRMQPVKDQLTLARAFVHLLDSIPDSRRRLRLVLAGDGPVRVAARDLLQTAGALQLAWLPGERSDIPEVMRGLDIFVLPSISEGMSNTILEAMATGLPVVATRVGGNPELVDESVGMLAPVGDVMAMSAALRDYIENPGMRRAHGFAARKMAERRFSLDAMVEGYLSVYDRVLNPKMRGAHAARPLTEP